VSVNLEAGTELGANGLLHAISSDFVSFVSEHIDLKAHQRGLSALQTTTLEGQVEEFVPDNGQRREIPSEPRDDGLDSGDSEPREAAGAFSLAEAAQREGRFEDAVRILEGLVSERGASDAETGSARLELARLYSRRLNEPQQAIWHLRRFLATYPNDVATESARDELCRLLNARGEEDPVCAD